MEIKSEIVIIDRNERQHHPPSLKIPIEFPSNTLVNHDLLVNIAVSLMT